MVIDYNLILFRTYDIMLQIIIIYDFFCDIVYDMIYTIYLCVFINVFAIAQLQYFITSTVVPNRCTAAHWCDASALSMCRDKSINCFMYLLAYY
jgi:hypothetical protein